MKNTSPPTSRLEALQKVIEALRDMNASDQNRILRTAACFLNIDLNAALDAESGDGVA